MAHVPGYGKYFTMKNNVFECVDCFFSTTDLNALREHRATHNSERLYYCTKCSFSSLHPYSIKRHMKVHEKAFTCTQCAFETADKLELSKHMNLHEKTQFMCDYCAYFSFKRSNLRRHHMRNHPNQHISVHTQTISEEPDPYKVTINDIKTILLDEDGAIQPDCFENALDDESYFITIDDIKQILQKKSVSTNEPPIFKCKICSDTFKYKYLLRKHANIHSTDKLFECPECGLRTKTKVHLQGHMKTHGKEVVFTCDLCEFTSTYWGVMQKHKIVHTGEKPFKCPLCSYRCGYQSSVRSHVGTMHTKPYECVECTFVTKNKEELFDHMEVHSSQTQIHDTHFLYNFITQTN